MQRQGGNQQQYSPQQPGTQQSLSQLQQQQQQSQFGQQISQQPSQTTTATAGIFSSFTVGSQQSTQQPLFSGQNQGFQQNRIQQKGVPQVIPNVTVGSGTMSNNQQQQGNNATAPNLIQKLNEITAPGGDILSKGKELIFMKFGLGGK